MLKYDGQEYVRFTGFARGNNNELTKYYSLDIGDVYRVEKYLPSINAFIIINKENQGVLVTFNEVELP